ncbi:hypothetical protein [Amylolactobacillus amylophilus]|uniref:hypothetical protein n=1 Tax=Amylolactobacillus amylophilus TaxID=1603 RepID=UPI0006D1E143|nr:hypothetical protein [Amylolactobacillus amylophilus]
MVLMTRLEKSIQEIATAHVNVGVEVEKLRVDQQNKLSLKSFPQHLSQDIAEYIEREFLTAQLEVVFPPAVVAEDNVALITEVMTELDQQLRPGERLWSFSCPPELPPHISESKFPPNQMLAFGIVSGLVNCTMCAELPIPEYILT